MASYQEKIKLTCSGCGHSYYVNMYPVVTTSKNPVIAKRVLRGEFFEHTCSKCGATNYFDYPVLYVDDDREFMVCYSKDELLMAKFEKDLAARHNAECADLDNEKIRLTSTQNAFYEKVNLLTYKVDDRVIEVAKVCILEALQAHNTFGEIEETIMTPFRDGDYMLAVISDKTESLRIKKEIIENVKAAVLPSLNLSLSNPTRVDTDMAIRFMDKYGFSVEF